MTDPDTDHTGIDHATLTRIVAASLGVPATIERREADEPLLGAGTGTQVVRIRGQAQVEAGTVPWSVVIKSFTSDHPEFQTRSLDPRAFDYWKREWCCYQAKWLQDLTGPLVAPRLYGAAEYEDQNGAPAGWVALEDLGELERRWPRARFSLLARHAGQLNGWSLTSKAAPSDPWLASSWLRGTTDQAESALAHLPAALGDPVLGRIITSDYLADAQQLWDARASAFDRLSALPQPLCHNDLFTATFSSMTPTTAVWPWTGRFADEPLWVRN